jgi:LETM1-like protein
VGLSFYGDGTKLLWSDVQYAGTLLAKAVSGTTLKPREVNTIRRTGKDLLTLIPFTIILIVPLTPVGHVLVFSFIQRFFPDFFPSCYTDKRVNLLKLYTEIEMDESKGLDLGEDPVEPMSLGSLFRLPWGGSEPAATSDKGTK